MSEMKWIYRAADTANALLMTFVALTAAALLLCGVFVLNDIYYTNRTAFVSYDLLQYRPSIHGSDSAEVQTLQTLKTINPDTVGWIELFGTNINYPVMQGSNDLEYLNKDIYGYNTMSGSIYLAAENESSWGDWYNMIYGHHMNSGAMFGDIEKYLDPDYFASHSEGILQTNDSDYSISVIACILTNAYEDLVYNVQDSAEERYPALYDYITKHSVNQSELPEQLDGVQLLGMSTCTDAVTNGRIVLFASVKPWDTTVDGNAAEKITSAERFKQTQNEPFRLTAVGHEQSREKWAALNLLCVCCTVLTLLPVWALKRKFRQFPYAKSKIRELEEADTASKTVVRDLRSFLRRERIGIILETVLCGIAVCAFCMTEDLHGRMTIEDQWTGGMILLTAAALAVDYLCLRYRGCRLE